MKQKFRVFLTLLLCAVASVGWGQTSVTIWEEDWSTGKKNDLASAIKNPNATYSLGGTSDGNYATIYESNTAGGTSPELLIPKKSNKQTFISTINLDGAIGNLTLTFNSNQNISITSTKGVTITKISGSTSNKYWQYAVTVPDGANQLVLTFAMTTENNARIDNIKLVGTKIVSVSISDCWNTGARWSHFMVWYQAGQGSTNSMMTDGWWKDAMQCPDVITRDQLPSLK